MPSSFAEQSMPCESTPRSAACLISTPFGSFAPTFASGALMPARDVRGAAHDLQRRAAGVDRAYAQLVRVRMLFERDDLRDDDAGERRSNRIDLFHFEAGHGQ